MALPPHHPAITGCWSVWRHSQCWCWRGNELSLTGRRPRPGRLAQTNRKPERATRDRGPRRRWWPYLGQVSGAPLQLACHDQHGLECAEPKVIVMLLGQLLPRQLVQDGHLLGQRLPMQTGQSKIQEVNDAEARDCPRCKHGETEAGALGGWAACVTNGTSGTRLK